MKVFKEKAQIQQGVPIDLFFSIPQCKKLPKNLEVTKFQRIFAEDCAALGNLKASFHCTRWHNLCRRIN